MLADLGANEEGGNIEVLFNDRHINYKKKNLFILNDLTLKEPIAKLEERTTKKKEEVLNLIINADEISSMSSIESENELWQSIENKAINKINVARNQYKDSDSVSMTSDMVKTRDRGNRRRTMLEDMNDMPPQESITSDNKALIEKFEKKMEKLKENHRLEVMTISNSLQAKAKEMVGTKLEEIKIKFESDTRILMSQLVELKSQLIDKDKQIVSLKDIIKNQEVTLKSVKGGIEKSITPDRSQENTITHNDDSNELHALKLMVEQSKSEVNAMRNLCNAYKKDENLARKELRELQTKFQESEERFKVILQERTQEYEMKILGLNSNIAAGKRELAKAKMNFELEIRILKALAQKYKEKENFPPVDPNRIHDKSSNKSFSQDKSHKMIPPKDDRRNSLKKDKRDNSVSFTDKRPDSVLDSGIPSRPESSEENTRLVNQLGHRRKLKKGEYDVDSHNTTFYSRDRSSLVTPDSTKYGSFATRPGTSLLDKSKMSNTFTDQSELL